MADFKGIKNFHEQVAAVLGTTIGVGISEETINMEMYAPTAFKQVQVRFPDIDIEALPEDDPKRSPIERAVIYTTALPLLTFLEMGRFKMDSTPAAKVEWFAIDWNSLRERLQGDLDGAIGELDPEYLEELMRGIGGFKLTYPDRKGRC